MGTIIVSTLEMKKLRLREIKDLLKIIQNQD